MIESSNSRRDFLKAAGIGAASLMLPNILSSCGKLKKRPNIIYIMADDHAAQAVGSYGSKINKTPNIDRIGNEGMRFENCFCTNSICAPSRAVLLTGKFSHINGLIDNRLEFDGSQVTFPKLLRNAGYETAMIGKWHLKSQPTGFDYWNILPGQGNYYNPDFIEMGEKKNHQGYVTDIITDFSLDWLGRRDTEKPFCLLLHHKAPHRNWMPDEKHLKMYDGADIPQPETFDDDYSGYPTRSAAAREQEMTIKNHMFDTWDLKIPAEGDTSEIKGIDRWYSKRLESMTDEQRKAWEDAYGPKNEAFKKAGLKGKELDNWKYQRYIKDYLRCIASIDDNVGRVLDYLDKNGLAENTIIIYTSDQGFYLGEHGWYDKRFMYEESLRMPLLIRYPEAIKKNIVNTDLVQNLDFAPTFLNLAEVDIPTEMQGNSLVPVLKGNRPADWRKSVYYHYYEYPAVHRVKRHYGVRTDRYKLIHFYHDIDAWELYDLKTDPNELNNLYGNAEYDEIVKDLKKELENLRNQYGDTDELPGNLNTKRN